MIYNLPLQGIPQDSRKDINNKILNLIESSDMQGITHQDVYDAYSGDGGLHGLAFKDFGSFYEYTEAKKEIENGQFFTPPKTCKTIVDIMGIGKTDLVCDLTMGHGAFFNFLPQQTNVFGCDIDRKSIRVAKFLYPKANIECCDVREYKPNVTFDYIIGNPPFNLDFGNISSQAYFCQKASELLKPNGLLAFIVPKSFMNDEMMNKSDINFMNDNFNFIAQHKLARNEFKDLGVDNFETKIMFFQRKSDHLSDVLFENVFTDLETIKVSVNDCNDLKKLYRVKVLSSIDTSDVFGYKIAKYLYEFKIHSNLQYYIPKAEALINKLKTQEKPEKMEYKEWEKIKLTPEKVLATFKRVMKCSNIVSKELIKLNKNAHSFTIKAYSSKTKHQLSKAVDVTTMSINALVTDIAIYNSYLKQCRGLGLDTRELVKVIRKKRNEYLIHNQPIKDLEIPNEIKKYTNSFKFIGDDGKKYGLHKIQKLDLNKVLLRNHTLLSWEQGVGKSIALLCVVKYLLKNKIVKKIFITAPAIAIDLTLNQFLINNNIDFINVKSSKQLKNVEDGKVLVMTLGRLSTARKEVKEFVKSKSNKVALIFDESDEITNYKSKRTRAVMNAFRRCKKTILMTGTVTRNNIGEFYPNYELMYNNSFNMMCLVKNIYKQDIKSKKINRTTNTKIGFPFGAYYGFGLFKSCFAPTKASVFGIQKDLQDIYNTDYLKTIVENSVITRTFEEVVGVKKKNHTIYVKPNYAEKTLQDTILNEFQSMCYSYFQTTGNSRKESYLRIIRMINLLIKSTQSPHLMREWVGQGLPTKYAKVMKMIESRPNEQILIGCVGIASTQSYYDEIKERYPNREVIYIDGTISFEKRKAIIKDFNKSENSIIVANQASLKSSVNIPECNTVIITGLPWNGSKLNQFTKRCVRFNSSTMTDIYIVCYSDSIELNILNLILNKEKVNQFIKTTDITTDEEVNEEYGVDASVLSSLIQKHYDEDGGMRLSWGDVAVKS